MDIMAILLITVILSFLLPGIIAFPLMVKHNHSWRVPALLVAWLVVSVGLLNFNKDVVIPYFIGFDTTVENVCSQVEKVNAYWK
jgi:hypothetical protein